MKVWIDRDGCISCGLCATTCPEAFRMADDGLAEVYGDVTADTEAARGKRPTAARWKSSMWRTKVLTEKTAPGDSFPGPLDLWRG